MEADLQYLSGWLGFARQKDTPKENFPSSFLCDCGHQSDFFENTIKEAKKMSRKKKIYLRDSAADEHIIVFYKGEILDIICPKAGLAEA
jgi:hypothetical protein